MGFKAKSYAAPTSWSNLLIDVVEKPGKLNPAFKQFHNYSIGNICLMLWQCLDRDISPGPIRTYNQWLDLGRTVKHGEKAIVLCQPKIWKKTDTDSSGKETFTPITFFNYYKKWFVLSQTEGEEIELPNLLGDWNKEKALDTLGITVVNFEHYDGNTLGYAKKKEIAISPVIPENEALSTFFHEIAHIVLGHTNLRGETFTETSNREPKNIREVEAESVAYLLLDTFDKKDSLDYSRGYIQNWLNRFSSKDAIPEKSANNIFKAANKILNSGLPDKEK